MRSQPDLGALYLAHRETMFKIAKSVLREAGLESQAMDVVQEAVLSVMASPPSGVRNWEAFLVTAVKRKAIDLRRSAAVRHSGPELDDIVRDGPDGADIADDVAQDVDRQRLAAVAWDSLSVLDARQRHAVWQTAALERPRKDVASELGVSPARVSQLSTQALKILLTEMTRREEQ